MERALKDGGNKDVTVKILPLANHRFDEAVTGGESHFPLVSRIVPSVVRHK
jgi:hypothetical protein